MSTWVLYFILLATQTFAGPTKFCEPKTSYNLCPDVAYRDGGHEDHHLDIYLPNKMLFSVPVVLLIHGGCFTAGDKSTMEDRARRLTAMGYAAVAINYRLANRAKGENLYPTAQEDVQDAVRWVRQHGSEYGLIVEKIVAYGESAGATLAMYLGTRPVLGSSQSHDQWAKPVTAVVDFFGRSDFSYEPNLKSDCPVEFLGVERTPETREAFIQASPIHSVSTKSARFLIVQGMRDQQVHFAQSLLLYSRLQSVHPKNFNERHLLEDGEHMFPGRQMDTAWGFVGPFLKKVFFPPTM